MATPTEAAYAAGLIDGEGSIWIGYPRPSQRAKTRSYYAAVAVGGTKLAPIQWIADRWGGKVNRVKATFTTVTPTNPVGYVDGLFFRWTKHGRGALGFLVDIEPYLVLKRESARLAIQLEMTKPDSSYQRRLRGQLDIPAQQAIYLKWRGLSTRHRGKEHLLS